MRSMIVPACIALTTSLVFSSDLAGQERFVVPRLQGPVQLDGLSYEPAWEAIPPLPVVGSFPDYGAPPSERTEIRLAYDDEHLYVAGRMYDSDPAGIRATSLRRDDGAFSNDWLVLNLDTFLDRETTLVFGTNPAGIRTDAVFTDDGTPPPNFDWNAFWDAAVTRNEEGWFAEIRIPLSSLRFEERDGKVVMGATVWRRIARKNEMISWPGIEHEWGLFSIFRASRMNEIVLEGVSPANPVYVTPYLLGGLGRTHRLSPGGDAFVADDHTLTEAGLDLKYTPTSNLTVDLTFNTDFAQVEADDQQVNLTRFSLFFPEKRLFFQERAGIFSYGWGGFGGFDRLFYSRRIGLEGGRPVRIYGGARAVARVEGWDIGALNMHTESLQGSAGINSGVLRLRRRVLNEHSYLGAIGTSRLEGGTGDRNLAYGLDALLRVARDDYLSVHWAQTFDHARQPEPDDVAVAAPGVRPLDRALARVHLERRGIYGVGWAAEIARLGEAFDPALGFVVRHDFTRYRAVGAFGWRAPDGSAVLRHRVALDGAAYRSNRSGALESAELVPSWLTEFRSGMSLSASARAVREDLEEGFSLPGGLEVPAGRHDFLEGSLRVDPSPAAPFRVTATAGAGSFYDGTRLSGSVSPVWNASVHLQLSGAVQVNRITFPARAQRATTTLTRLRALVMLNSRLSSLAFVQYSDASDAAVVNLRLRYNPAEGNDLYVVYNHGVHTDRFGHDPVRPLTDNATVMLKYSRTLRLGLQG